MKRLFQLGFIAALVTLSLSSCKKEEAQEQTMGIPSEYYIKGSLKGQQVEAKTQSPVNVSINEGLTCLINLSNQQDYAMIGIGSTAFYSEADILALKGKTLSYGMGRDQALFVWFENGAMMSSNWTVQDANSNFKVTDIVAVGTNASGKKTFALRGSFQCKVKDNVNAVNATMLNGNYTILVAENSI